MIAKKIKKLWNSTSWFSRSFVAAVSVPFIIYFILEYNFDKYWECVQRLHFDETTEERFHPCGQYPIDNAQGPIVLLALILLIYAVLFTVRYFRRKKK